MQEKPSFANEINMSLSKIPFNFRQPLSLYYGKIFIPCLTSKKNVKIQFGSIKNAASVFTEAAFNKK